LRAACPQWNDSQIEGSLTVIDLGQSAGFERESAILAWMDGARQASNDPQALATAYACGAAVINQVYGW
jgi:hypothetical protein